MKRVYVVNRYDKGGKGRHLVGVWSSLKDIRNFLYNRNDVLIDSTKHKISVKFANCIYFIEETILDFNVKQRV